MTWLKKLKYYLAYFLVSTVYDLINNCYHIHCIVWYAYGQNIIYNLFFKDLPKYSYINVEVTERSIVHVLGLNTVHAAQINCQPLDWHCMSTVIVSTVVSV